MHCGTYVLYSTPDYVNLRDLLATDTITNTGPNETKSVATQGQDPLPGTEDYPTTQFFHWGCAERPPDE
jgi:hypothetical protein